MMNPEELFQNQMTGTLLNFESAIQRIHTERAMAYPSGEELVGLARALCLNDGNTPDNLVLGYPRAQPCMDGKQTTAFVGPVRPLWWHYLGEASAALRFMEAAKTTDKADTKTMVDFMGEIRRAAGR